MNSKEFLAVLSDRAGLSSQQTSKAVEALVEKMTERLCEGDSVSVQGFGSFEVRKKNERVMVIPSTKQRMLVPPKLSLVFQPAQAVKERFK